MELCLRVTPLWVLYLRVSTSPGVFTCRGLDLHFTVRARVDGSKTHHQKEIEQFFPALPRPHVNISVEARDFRREARSMEKA